jgi:hypothetical protein
VRRTFLAVSYLLLFVPAAFAAPADEIARDLWPAEFHQLSDIGRGKAIIFTPDLAPPGNRAFYEGLGFEYFESTSWLETYDWIRSLNLDPREVPIRTLILEVHGSNGHGLTLQSGRAPDAARSYSSVGALEEHLDGTGITVAVVGACNAGRLFRPSISLAVNDHLERGVLPATREIVNATGAFVRGTSGVTFLRRRQSQLETTMEGHRREFSPESRAMLRGGGAFAISSLLIQMLLDDESLQMAGEECDERLSFANLPRSTSEALMQRFIALVNGVAGVERRSAPQIAGIAPADSLSDRNPMALHLQRP